MTLALTSEFVALLNKDFRKSAAPMFDATKLPAVRACIRYAIVAVDDISRAMEALEQANDTCPERLSLVEMCCRVVQFVR
jgi:hypothetical protein